MLKIQPVESQSERFCFIIKGFKIKVFTALFQTSFQLQSPSKEVLVVQMKFNSMQQKLQEGFKPSVVRRKRALYQESYLSVL